MQQPHIAFTVKRAQCIGFNVIEIYHIYSHSQALVGVRICVYAVCKHVFLYCIYCMCVVCACSNILLLAYFTTLLVASSQNEIFSEACPKVKLGGILRILTKGDHNERP